MHKAVKAGLTIGCVAVLGAGGFGAYNVVDALAGGHSAGPQARSTEAGSGTAPGDEQSVKLARSFLDGWAAGPGHYQGAAGDTDAPEAARAALQGYHDGLKLTRVNFDGVTAAGPDPQLTRATRVTFTVTAEVAGGTWTYPGALDVVSGGGRPAVHWAASVLHPALKDGQSLAAGALPAQAATASVVARDGRTVLTADHYPSLTEIIATIGHHAPGAGQDSGSGVAVVDGSGEKVSAVKTFQAPELPSVTTTIDPGLQAAAERAVLDPQLGGKRASVAALDRRTGHILAIAYHGTDGNTAINAALAPGSTLKIVTAAALFDRTGMTPSSPAPCNKEQVAAGQAFHNEADVPVNPGSTIEEAFAVSCNTAFIYDGFRYLVHGDEASALHDEAQQVFGLGSWSIGGGVQTADPSIPAQPRGSDKAAQFIGQGQVTMSPLVVASLAATVRDGAFHQPVILPGQPQTPASRPLSPATASALREMMRAAVDHGTATPRLGGLPGAGAKTGTAEVGDSTTGWFTAYDDDIAVASLVEGGSSGVDSAGHVVRTLLTTPYNR
ncbi:MULTISPECIES: penicillin-binding transpeptidase domain-containing protein [Streptomycetaceae]|uniref:Penicillin-binding protein (Secreted protein) n=1 Tax=Streptantibioticus cattleyicolor (strain ATCC 35852 / DSM 46488 / JCM 4925 / NBRC 14057 / NRRL 8057) TaxID=1003195 RepID=F8JV58_STREN|nr:MULTISPECIES: penicillin-binding transpeptidase domain-containing protein [Streptomycetaceae]AEW93141.1 penicillin-binding protein (secreted protein) [Streptantibioticus cattleyicolor NRRL 8057 = DSM 46488]MYS57869.1 penicillin-binding protein [Streptomyces sp. SID5468]CCB73500.1 putative Penicillin-binding protein [Streptantibioticus cattleyicolor NRRL 8057 = DSM 46488]